MFAALSEFSNDADSVIEGGSIIRQRRAEPVIVLVVRPADCEKVLRQLRTFPDLKCQSKEPVSQKDAAEKLPRIHPSCIYQVMAAHR